MDFSSMGKVFIPSPSGNGGFPVRVGSILSRSFYENGHCTINAICLLLNFFEEGAGAEINQLTG
jgi:hypothetical protein